MIQINLMRTDKTEVLEYMDWAMKHKPDEDECGQEGYKVCMARAANFLLTGDRNRPCRPKELENERSTKKN